MASSLADAAEDFWSQERQAPLRRLLSIFHFALFCSGWGFLYYYGQRNLEMPRGDAGPIQLYGMIFAGLFLVVTVHELGHALVAWSVGFRFHTVRVGPLTIVKDSYGARHVMFDWSKFLSYAGYMGAVPASEEHVRSNAILVIFAGPFASLNAALLLWIACLQLRGTPWAVHWDLLLIVASLFFADFIVNLIPVGYCDGTMLLHLILWTEQGQDLYSRKLSSKTAHEAAQRRIEGDRAGEVHLLKEALDQMLAGGERNSAGLGRAYQSLGFAQIRAGKRDDGASNLKKSLEIFESCRNVDPVHEGESWVGLYGHFRAHWCPAEAQRANAAALNAFERAKQKHNSGLNFAAILHNIAQLHTGACRPALALPEIDQALVILSTAPKNLLSRADLLRLRSDCEFQLGNRNQGFVAAEEAASLARRAAQMDRYRNDAAQCLANLGITLWRSGAADQAVNILNECAQLFDDLGQPGWAAAHRIYSATVLRREGRIAEAGAALPSEEQVGAKNRAALLDELAQIKLDLGRSQEAIEALTESLRLAKEAHPPSPVDVASVEAYLAEAYFETGNIAEAEKLAAQACEKLKAARHPDAAECLITLALIACVKQEDPYSYLEEGLQMCRNAPFVDIASKAYFYEESAKRLQRAGREQEAGEFLLEAEAAWKTLGLPRKLNDRQVDVSVVSDPKIC